MKYWERFLCGLGAVVFVYMPLRLAEDFPAIVFIVLFLMNSYCVGCLMTANREKANEAKGRSE